jgi:hypothetical protein
MNIKPTTIVGLLIKLSAIAVPAFAQPTAERRTSQPVAELRAGSAGLGAGPERQLASDESGHRIANKQSISHTGPPKSWLESKADDYSYGTYGRGMPGSCFMPGHYYVASVVNSVPPSCFLGNSGAYFP